MLPKSKINFHFRDNFNQKKLSQLGKEAISSIQEKSEAIFLGYLEKVDNKKGLLIGKIQSGKTSQYISLISWAFDYDYDLVIVFSGIDLTINQQTTDRLQEVFEGFDSNGVTCSVLSSRHNYQNKIANIAYYFQNKKQKLVFSVMKNPKHLANLIDFLSQLQSQTAFKILIIDDEGDLASLNSKKFFKNSSQPSKIHHQIVEITKILKTYNFLSVTATPYANILLELKDWLSPDFLYFLEPGRSYFGLQEFVNNSNQILKSIEENYRGATNSLENQWKQDWPPLVFQKALAYFLLATAFIKQTNPEKSHPPTTMLIHSEWKNFNQDALYQKMEKWFVLLKKAFESYFAGKETVEVIKLKQFLKSGYDLFTPQLQKEYFLDFQLYRNIFENLTYHTENVLISSSKMGRTMREQTAHFPLKHRILIGAKLVERGITFSHLLTVFLTRRAKTVSLFDTTKQRARWFGYPKYKRFLKVFLPANIANDFYNLAISDYHLDDALRIISHEKIPSQQWDLAIINGKQDMEITSKRRVRLLQNRISYNNFQIYFSPLQKRENELLNHWKKRGRWTTYVNVSHKELETDNHFTIDHLFLKDREYLFFLLKEKLQLKKHLIDDIFEKILQANLTFKIILINGLEKERYRTCQHFSQEMPCLPTPVYTGYQIKNPSGYKGDTRLYQYPLNRDKIIFQVHQIDIRCKQQKLLKKAIFYALQLPKNHFDYWETTRRFPN